MSSYKKPELRKWNYEKYCACGCGGKIWHFDSQGRIRYYKLNHGNRLKRKEIDCECGCNEKLIIVVNAKSWVNNRRFKKGHKKRPRRIDWEGHKKIDCYGYTHVYKPNHPYATKDGYVREHRLVMEKKLGRYLKSYEVIHHIDGDKGNNKINNLELMTSKTHRSEHAKKLHDRFKKYVIKKRVCTNCGSNDTYFHKKENVYIWCRIDDKWFCRKCYRKLVHI